MIHSATTTLITHAEPISTVLAALPGWPTKMNHGKCVSTHCRRTGQAARVQGRVDRALLDRRHVGRAVCVSCLGKLDVTADSASRAVIRRRNGIDPVRHDSAGIRIGHRVVEDAASQQSEAQELDDTHGVRYWPLAVGASPQRNSLAAASPVRVRYE